MRKVGNEETCVSKSEYTHWVVAKYFESVLYGKRSGFYRAYGIAGVQNKRIKQRLNYLNTMERVKMM